MHPVFKEFSEPYINVDTFVLIACLIVFLVPEAFSTMAESCQSHVASALLFILIVLHDQLVLGYESVYDSLERRKPTGRIFETSEHYYNRYRNGDRYSTYNRGPSSVYSSIRPPDNNERTRSFSSFGNGYDNLGNGRRNEWNNLRSSFEPFRSRFDRRRPLEIDGRFERFDYNSQYDDPRFTNFRDSSSRSDQNIFNREGSSSLLKSDDFLRNKGETLFNKSPEETLPLEDVRDFDASYDAYDDLRDRRPVYRRSEPRFYNREYFKPKFSTGYSSKNSDENYEASSGERGGSGLSKVDSFVKQNEDKNQKKTDEGFQDSAQGTKTDFQSKEKIGESTRLDKNGGNKSTVRSNRVTKKGHSTKGFATHHHKDETGNSTTFFDESIDSGGQSDFQDMEDEFGSKKLLEIHNGKEDGRFSKENGGKSGRYGSGILRGNQKYEKDILSSDDGFKKEEKFGLNQGATDQGYKSGGEYVGGGQWDSYY